MEHQTPNLAKSLKNNAFFNIFAYSACYNLTSNLIKTSIHFDMKIDQKFIKNQSKKDIKLKVDFGNICFLIFARFQLDFGSILAPKWAKFCPENPTWERYRAQNGFQRPSGPHLGPSWERFGSIFEQFLVNFLENFNLIFNQRHVSTNLSPYFVCTYLAPRLSCQRISF